jgi:Protein of unknown function (DUF2806)
MTDDPPKEGSEGTNSKPLVEAKISVLNLDLKGLDKFERVASNIVEALKRGIGRFYEPIGRIRDAKADRFVANERAQTMIDVTAKAGELAHLRKRLGFEADELRSSQAARSIEYFLEDFSRRQHNREKTAQAFILASNSEPPAEDASNNIDQDWLTKFWTLAESISNKELQGFLALLLTKETRKPGAVSPLTLNTLSTLTPQVAECLERFCRLSIQEGDEAFVIHPNVFTFQHIGPLEEYGIRYSDLYELESFGLIRSAQTIMLNYAADQAAVSVDYAGIPASLTFSGLQLHLIYLTRSGRELRALLHLTPVPEYTQALQGKLKAAFTLN